MQWGKKKLIEYYDYQKDPVKIYFVDKMHQVVLQHNKSLMAKEDDFLGRLTGPDSREQKVLPNFQQFLHHGKSLYEVRKAKQETEWFLVYKFLEKENKSEKQELIHKFQLKSKIFDRNSEIIASQLDSQKKIIQAKLCERKKRSVSRSRVDGLSLKEKEREDDSGNRLLSKWVDQFLG